jgi:carbon monoxide dehydrogenase subunit G
MKQGWRELTVTSELTRAEPPRAIAFRTVDSGPITASGSYDIRPEGQGTHVVVDVVIEARGFMRLFEPVMGPTLRKTAERYEQDLARRLG